MAQHSNLESPGRSFALALAIVLLIGGLLAVGGITAYQAWVEPQVQHVEGRCGPDSLTRCGFRAVEDRTQGAQETIEDIREKKNRIKVFIGTLASLFNLSKSGSGTTP